MIYLGGKTKLAKHILPIILKDRKPNQIYFEPFLGGANTFHLVENPKIGSDISYKLISLLRAIRGGWIPPTEVSEELYQAVALDEAVLAHQAMLNHFQIEMDLQSFLNQGLYESVEEVIVSYLKANS